MAAIKTYQNMDSCPECGGMVTHNAGETVCTDCNIVLEDSGFNMGQNRYQEHINKGHKSTTPVSHDKGLGSQISFRGELNSQRYKFSRLRDWQESKQFTGFERNKRKGMGEVQRLTSALELPESVKKSSGRLWKQAHNAGLAGGRGIDTIASACVYLIARQQRIVRERSEWKAATQIDYKRLRMGISVVQRKLSVGYEPTKPSDYLALTLDKFDLYDHQRERVAAMIAEIENKNAYSGKRSQNLIAGAVYLVAHMTQQEVGDVIGISPRSVRNNKNHIEKHVDVGALQ